MEPNRLSSHILPTSATMVGVCMMVISVVNLSTVQIRQGVIDELLAVDAVVFLASVIASYMSLRRRDARQADELERVADRLFIAGMILMVGAGVWFAFFVV